MDWVVADVTDLASVEDETFDLVYTGGHVAVRLLLNFATHTQHPFVTVPRRLTHPLYCYFPRVVVVV